MSGFVLRNTFWQAIDNFQRLEMVLHPAKDTIGAVSELRKYSRWGFSWKVLLDFFESARLSAAFSFKGIFPFDKELVNEHFLFPAVQRAGQASSSSNSRGSGSRSGGTVSSTSSHTSTATARFRLDKSQITECHNHSLCIGYQKGFCSEASAGASHSKMIKKPGQASAAPVSLLHKCLKCLNSSKSADHPFVSCPN